MNEHEGIMEQIRNALMGGAKPKDLVAQGFPKSTVYTIANKLKKASANPANEKGKAPAKPEERRPPEYPMVNVPLSSRQGWTPATPGSIRWIMIGSFHVQPEVIALYNHYLEEVNPDMAFDEFVSEAVKGFFLLVGKVPAIVTGSGSTETKGVNRY